MRASIVSAKDPWSAALVEGLERHRVRTTQLTTGTDFVVCWGWRNGYVWRRRGHTVLVMERGYVGDRFASLSLAWNGLNNRGTAPRADDGGERWRRRYGHLLRPWRKGGEYALLVGQVRNDAAVGDLDIQRWYVKAAARMRERFPALPVLFRPHPVEIRRGLSPAVPGVPTLHGSLADALERAAVVVTYNSGTGIDAALAGVPVIACDEGSMAWDVAAHGLDADLVRPDRDAWCAQLAWRQWSLDEVRDGTAWEHLRDARP